MSFHIIFTDGSNPYVRFNMTFEEFEEELKKWGENYILEHYASAAGVRFYEAKPKQ